MKLWNLYLKYNKLPLFTETWLKSVYLRMGLDSNLNPFCIQQNCNLNLKFVFISVLIKIQYHYEDVYFSAFLSNE